MEFIKKFAKELSVFGLVIVVFLGLFVYRQMTFKDYTTISKTKLTKMVNTKEDFAIVLGDSTNATMQGFQNVMQKFTTKNRSTPLYYLDSSEDNKFESYVEKTLNIHITYPATIIVKDGKVVNKKEGALNYYALNDFIQESLDK